MQEIREVTENSENARQIQITIFQTYGKSENINYFIKDKMKKITNLWRLFYEKL